MLDLDDVWVFFPAMKRTALHVELLDYQKYDTCALTFGEYVPNEALVHRRLRGGSGSRPYDIVTTSSIGYLVSERVVDVLKGHSGWSLYPVRVLDKQESEIPGYHGLAVTGRCGPIDFHKGRDLWRGRPGSAAIKRWTRNYLYFDPASWDGSDMFCQAGSANFMVVSRLAQALKKAKITNLNLWRLSEY